MNGQLFIWKKQMAERLGENHHRMRRQLFLLQSSMSISISLIRRGTTVAEFDKNRGVTVTLLCFKAV